MDNIMRYSTQVFFFLKVDELVILPSESSDDLIQAALAELTQQQRFEYYFSAKYFVGEPCFLS